LVTVTFGLLVAAKSDWWGSLGFCTQSNDWLGRSAVKLPIMCRVGCYLLWHWRCRYRHCTRIISGSQYRKVLAKFLPVDCLAPKMPFCLTTL